MTDTKHMDIGFAEQVVELIKDNPVVENAEFICLSDLAKCVSMKNLDGLMTPEAVADQIISEACTLALESFLSQKEVQPFDFDKFVEAVANSHKKRTK